MNQNIIDGIFILIFTVQYPEWLILEVGADRPGDHAYTACAGNLKSGKWETRNGKCERRPFPVSRFSFP